MAVVVITLGALGVRLAAVAAFPYKTLGVSDAYFYHASANLMARGIFGVNPIDYYQVPGHPKVASADFPPLFSGVLALASVVGAKSVLAHRIWCSFIGAAAVPLGMLFGRQLVGRRVGVIAGLIIALYPNLWMSDTMVLSETLTPILVLLILMAAYHFWRRPAPRSAILLGVALGAAALARDELALLVVLILVPLALLVRASFRRRVGLLGCALAAAGVVVGPWVGWNLSRFDKPVFISSGLGVTLASVDCDQTWYGPAAGYWSLVCVSQARVGTSGDESVRSSQAEAHALRYVDHHLGGLPRITAIRVARGFGLYQPIQQLRFDTIVETRPQPWTYVGLYSYYGLALLSIGGAILLRRRRVLVFPLLAVGVDVAITMAIGFGDTRYRTAFEVCLVVLAAVELDAVSGWLMRRRRHQADRVAPQTQLDAAPVTVAAARWPT